MMQLKQTIQDLRQSVAERAEEVENAKNAVATAGEIKITLATALAAATKTFKDAYLAFTTAADNDKDNEDLLAAVGQAQKDKNAAVQNAASGDVAFSQAELRLQTAEQELIRINAELAAVHAEYTQLEEEEVAKKAAAEEAEKKQKQLALEKIAQDEAAAAAKNKQTQRTIVDEDEDGKEGDDMDIESGEDGENDWHYQMPVTGDLQLAVEMSDELQLKEIAKYIGKMQTLKNIKVKRIGQKPECICCGKLAHAYKQCPDFEVIEKYVALFRGVEERAFVEFAEQIFADKTSQRRLQGCMETSHAYLHSLSEKNRKELEEFPLSLQSDKHCQLCLETFKSKAKALDHRKSYDSCPIMYILALLFKKKRGENVDAFYGDGNDESDAEAEVAAPPAKKSKMPKVAAAAVEVEAEVEAEEVEAVETEDAKLIAIVTKFDGAMYRMSQRIAALEENGKAKDHHIHMLQCQVNLMSRDLDEIRSQPSQEMHTPVKRIRPRAFDDEDAPAESIDPALLMYV